MSFELSQTPTLEAVATDDDQALALDLQVRVAEAMTQVEAMPEVARAMDESRRVAEELARLRSAERTLNQTAKDAREKLEQAGQSVLDALVNASASGSKMDWKPATAATALEDQLRFTGRAIERLTEHRIPLMQIASLREEAHALEAQARGLEAIAQERAQKVLGQIRAAVSEEMVLPVDLSKGVAGALLARARDWKQRAVQLSAEADTLERKYQDRV